MYADIFSIIAPILLCALLGYGWSRSGAPFETEFVSRLVMSIGVPCLIVGTLSKVEIPASHFNEILIAAVLILLLTGALAALFCRVIHQPARSFLTPLTFSNSGNMGLPLSLFAFGEEGLTIALGIFLLMSLMHFSVGVAVLSGGSVFRSVLRSPIVYAALISVSLVYSGSQLPEWLQNTVELLGGISIPMMLITLGFSLRQLEVKGVALSTVLAVARLMIGVSVGFLVVELLSLEGVMRGVVIIQSSMPAAVFNYLLALRYQRDPEAVAGMVVISTGLSFMLLPAVLWLVL